MGNTQSASDNVSSESLNKTDSILMVRDDLDSSGTQNGKNKGLLEFKLLGKDKKFEENNIPIEFNNDITEIEMLSPFNPTIKSINIERIECVSNAEDEGQNDSLVISDFAISQNNDELISIKKELENEKAQNLKLNAEKNVLIQVKANLNEEIIHLKQLNDELKMRAKETENLNLNVKDENEMLRKECALLNSELTAFRSKEADLERSKNEILQENQRNHHELKKEIESLRNVNTKCLFEISNKKIKSETKSKFTQTDFQINCASKLIQTDCVVSGPRSSIAPLEQELNSSQMQSQCNNLTTSPILNERKSFSKTRQTKSQNSCILAEQALIMEFKSDIKSENEKAKEIMKKDLKKKPLKNQKIRNLLDDISFATESPCSKHEKEINQNFSVSDIKPISISSFFNQTSTQKENKPRIKRKNSEYSDLIDLTIDDDNDFKPTFSQNCNDTENKKVRCILKWNIRYSITFKRLNKFCFFIDCHLKHIQK
jgi:hypothetical protein